MIAQAPGAIGRQQVDALVDYLKANPGTAAVKPAGTASVDNKLLTKDNVDDPANADYVYKASC